MSPLRNAPSKLALAALLGLVGLVLPTGDLAAAQGAEGVAPEGEGVAQEGEGAPRSAPLPPEITVFGERGADPELHRIGVAEIGRAQPEVARLLRRMPGANVNANGPLSGQVQYRGLSSVRVNVVVDGVYISPGGPNWMDPPLHYLPEPLFHALEMRRGIAGVSAGAETIGGSIVARSKTSRFGEGPGLELHGDLSLSGHTVDSGTAMGGLVSLANQSVRFHVLGSLEGGDDQEFPDGDVIPTEYERSTLGGGFALRLGEHELGLDYRHHRTGDTGTPALPMDIGYFHSEIWRASYAGELGGLRVSAGLFGTDIDHQMNNFELRPVASLALARFADAKNRALGYELRGSMDLMGGEFVLGADGHLMDQDMLVRNPNSAAFFVGNFNDVERDRYGFFAQWTGELGERWNAELGLRYNRVRMDAGDVSLAPGLPPPAQGLKDAFNARDRDRGDDNVDWVAKLDYALSDELLLRLGVARKTRSPYYIERYAWLPLEVTAGLADGNNYVGDIELDPEVSHELDLGLDFRGERMFFAPRAFYRRVDDYIQGVPVDATPSAIDSPLEMVSNLNGDPTPLRFANVDAQLYGADLVWRWEPLGEIQLDGVLSFVRGRRRDIADDLYRIAPLTGTFAATYRRDRWAVTLETEFAAEQRGVARTNQELETSGYGIASLYVRGQVRDDLVLELGVRNLLDKRFREHLGGFSRILGNPDVQPGERLPGAGRSLLVNVGYEF